VSPSTAAEASTRTKVKLEEQEGFVIPPGQFAFLLTEECVEVPSSALAFISMKARIKFKGLVNVSGFHVDPGYKGRLIFAVFNAGPLAVHLARGDDCFLIWYVSLDADSKRIRTSPPWDGITSELITPVSGEVQSLKGLSDRIMEVEREQRVAAVRTGILITLASTLIVLLITLSLRFWYLQPAGSPASAPAGSGSTTAPSGGSVTAPSAAPSTQPPPPSAAPANSIPRSGGRSK
jgi:dCTP deaminase